MFQKPEWAKCPRATGCDKLPEVTRSRVLLAIIVATLTIGGLMIAFSGPAGPVEKVFASGYTKPGDLFFIFLKEDRPYISQTQKEHFAANGYLATDIGTNKRKLEVYAPSVLWLDSDGVEHDAEVDYRISTIKNYGTTGLSVVLEMDNGYSFLIGHMSEVYLKDGARVTTGQVIGKSGGCLGELKFDEKSTGCHIHLEYRSLGSPTPYPAHYYNNHGDELKAKRKLGAAKNDHAGKISQGLALAYDDKRYLNIAGGDQLAKVVSAIHSRENGRCAKNCQMSLAGARGPLQFMPKTWEAYGCDGDGDSIADVEDLEDAICGAANYLQTLRSGEGAQAPGLDEKWIWWRVAYRYNAGYQTQATHADGFPGGIAYADAIVETLEDMGAF